MILVEPAALEDIEAARTWYSEIRAELGQRFELAIDQAITGAGEQPELFPLVYRNAKRVRLRRFPYSVYFVFVAENNLVRVVACTHAKRADRHWKQRLQ